jgi:hypothetical protein
MTFIIEIKVNLLEILGVFSNASTFLSSPSSCASFGVPVSIYY